MLSLQRSVGSLGVDGLTGITPGYAPQLDTASSIALDEDDKPLASPPLRDPLHPSPSPYPIEELQVRSQLSIHPSSSCNHGYTHILANPHPFAPTSYYYYPPPQPRPLSGDTLNFYSPPQVPSTDSLFGATNNNEYACRRFPNWSHCAT
jgi:hypothetical protein